MKRAALGILVALAVGLTACGGGGGKDDASKSDKSEDSGSSRGQGGSHGGGSGGSGESGDGGSGEGSGDSGDPGAGNTEEEQQYVDALLEAFGNSSDMSDDQTNCIVEAYIDTIGLERLQAVVSPEDLANNPNPSPVDLGIELTAEDGEVFYDHLSGCIDIRETFLNGMTAENPELSACLDREINDDLLKRYVVAIFLADAGSMDPDLENQMTAVFTTCSGASGT
ncbi:MAG TPA: hypothetical protein VGJ86_05935 [Acidimicrobiales bacterium]|jgi:hypothetical protein